MKHPQFSIILPAHNAAATISATIASVLDQTVRDFELLAIDDGSTDSTLQILLAFAAKDARIRVINQANQGVSAARNFGVALAKADLLAFLDADDLWNSDKLAHHLSLHQAQPQISASYARIAFFSDDAAPVRRPKTLSTIIGGSLKIQHVLEENPVCTMSNLVVRKSTFARIGGFDQSMSFAEDQEWLARAAHAGLEIWGIDDVLVDYRLSPDGLSVNLDRMYDGWRRIADRYAHTANRDRADAIYCRYLARRALRAGAPSSVARHYAFRGLGLDAKAFFADRKRGGFTLLSSVAAAFIPARTRQIIFS